MVSEQFFEAGRYDELTSVLSPQTEMLETNYIDMNHCNYAAPE